MIVVLIEVFSYKGHISNKKIFYRLLKCLLHLPFVNLCQAFRFLFQLKSAAESKEAIDKHYDEMNDWIISCKALDENIEWVWAEINKHLTNNVSKDARDFLKELVEKKYNDSFKGQASVKLKKMVDEKKEELANVKSEIQEFKVA